MPSWLTPSSTSGTVGTGGTTITFSVNASANALATGTTTIIFTNTTNGQGNTSRTASLTVNALAALQVSTASNIAASGNSGGPFSPSAFSYTLTAASSSVGYSISGVPSWLTASSTSGTVDSAGTTITFSVNSSANALATGSASPATISFTNTTNGQGTQTRAAELATAQSITEYPIPAGGSPAQLITAGPDGALWFSVSTSSGSESSALIANMESQDTALVRAYDRAAIHNVAISRPLAAATCIVAHANRFRRADIQAVPH